MSSHITTGSRRKITVSATRPKRGEESRDPLKNFMNKAPLTFRRDVAEKLAKEGKYEILASISQASRNTREVEGSVSRQINEKSLEHKKKITDAILKLMNEINENIKDATRLIEYSHSIRLETPILNSKDNLSLLCNYIIEIHMNYNKGMNEVKIFYQKFNSNNLDYPENIDYPFIIDFPSQHWNISTRKQVNDALNSIPIRFFEKMYISSFIVNILNKYSISYYTLLNKPIGEFYKSDLPLVNNRITINKPFKEFITDIQAILTNKFIPSTNSRGNIPIVSNTDREEQILFDKTKKGIDAIATFYNVLVPITRGGRKKSAK